MSIGRIFLTYPVCGVFFMLGNLTNPVSPLVLVVMSLERCVAVCYPLRHAAIVTIRNTAVAVMLVWAICLAAYTYFLFVSAALAISSTYVVVILAARSASTDKASALKARNTLLMHLLQLGLIISSTIHNPLLYAVSRLVFKGNRKSSLSLSWKEPLLTPMYEIHHQSSVDSNPYVTLESPPISPSNSISLTGTTETRMPNPRSPDDGPESN
ncbi:unnamed protein product [Menidia menidia]|uniref:(Atlantic silverside) hypothetical protein n=1 Tax=Menidia menidia TaxID=238744 RepID=A0A8S4A6Y9_9TELE|nr:unnamed protein product [Menidia menidia]